MTPLERALENRLKDLHAKIYQHLVVYLLQHKRLFSPGLIQLIKQLPAEGDNVVRELLSEAAQGRESIRPLACKKGCSDCCGLVVKATEPELYVIFEYLLQTRSDAELAALMQTLGSQLQSKQGCAARNERIKVTCSFLNNKSCSIYEVRPLACRAWNSTNVQDCIAYLTDSEREIPSNPFHYAPYDTIRKAIIKALHAVGLEDIPHELNAGVLRLLKGEYGD